MKKALFLSIIILLFASCQQKNKFHITGTIKNAKGQMLILEHDGLMKTDRLDSMKLSDSGTFSFTAEKPKYPDFYDIRIGNKVITFSVDSTETISVDADFDNNFSTGYSVAGSDESRSILKLRKSLMDLQIEADKLTNDLPSEERNALIRKISEDIEKHKAMARKMILSNPKSTTAYFALYQKLSNSYLFSPYVSEDRPYFSAVATAYDAYMPEYVRSKNIYSLVLAAINTDRREKAEKAMQQASEQSNTGYIDIKLKDKNGKERKLSELQGKVVLIDFSAYESQNSVDYTFALRDLYNRFHSNGFEIYQVSLDRNKIIWQQSVKNIPWICVRDEQGPNTVYVETYNISSVPTYFLMNRMGVITSRNTPFAELSKEIQKDLK